MLLQTFVGVLQKKIHMHAFLDSPQTTGIISVESLLNVQFNKINKCSVLAFAFHRRQQAAKAVNFKMTHWHFRKLSVIVYQMPLLMQIN